MTALVVVGDAGDDVPFVLLSPLEVGVVGGGDGAGAVGLVAAAAADGDYGGGNVMADGRRWGGRRWGGKIESGGSVVIDGGDTEDGREWVLRKVF